MSNRKTTTEKIAEQKTRMEQMQNEMKRLMNLQKAEERKKRNHRICKRGAHLESLLPDTIGLSDERFFAFLEKTAANGRGREILASFVAEQEKENDANNADNATDGGDVPVEPATVATAQSGNMPPPKSTAPPHSNGEHSPANTAQTKNATTVSDGSNMREGTREAG